MLTNKFVEETIFLYLVIFFLMLVSILLCWESVLQADAELQKRAKVNFIYDVQCTIQITNYLTQFVGIYLKLKKVSLEHQRMKYKVKLFCFCCFFFF